MARITRPSGIAALTILIIGLSAPTLYQLLCSLITSLSLHVTSLAPPTPKPSSQPAEPPSPPPPAAPFTCLPHAYRTEIVSLDPLLIYIDSFLTAAEISSLLSAGEPSFLPSRVYKRGHDRGTSDRTSSSAALPRSNAAVQCVLARASAFLGAMLDPARDDVGPPQLVRYTAGQRFNRHRDWYERARRGAAGSWNRVASFFAVLQDGCAGGETWFPLVNGTAPAGEGEHGRPRWRRHEDGGLAFRPVAGNALFWVNLFANGTGDDRTVHAGLPVTDGLKTAMNIWPRKFYG
ncbi:hypothetical protein F4804DRAFT_87709 [Jackrogersella minutella]|nr:hypothetical protein F4804DRAFT_87709 [Jackrogersella minutella]